MTLEHGYLVGRKTFKEYSAWAAMKARCKNPKATSFKRYGGRGIKVCKEWETFSNFFKDMGTSLKGQSLDRIDNSKGYYKENCRWATPRQQANNRRGNKLLEFNGTTKTMREWCRILKLNYITVKKRLENEWTINKALSTNTK